MSTKPDREALLVEYSAANDVYIHFDSYSWTVGAVLIASAFIFWGFIISIPPQQEIDICIAIILSTLLISLISLWMLYADHNRQIVLSKLHRIHEIEKILGMEQHTRWVEKDNKKIKYRTFGIKGHIIDLLIYLVISIGTLLICILRFGCNNYWAIPIFICLATFIFVRVNEYRITKYLKKFPE